jgi:exosortase/archaeosortase family protein
VNVAEHTSAQKRGHKRVALLIGLYLVLYAAMQALYQALRSSSHSHWLIDKLTVAPAAWLVGTVYPEHGVWAQGPRLAWPEGRMHMLAGCDGFEILALYLPAVLVAPVSWRRGLLMLGVGSVLIWLLNQTRLLALYSSYRFWPEGFDALHTLWGPVLMLAAVFAFYTWQLHQSHPRPTQTTP